MVRKASTRFISERVAHQNGTKEIPSSVEWHFLHNGLKLLNQLALATGSVWGKLEPPAQTRVYFDSGLGETHRTHRQLPATEDATCEATRTDKGRTTL